MAKARVSQVLPVPRKELFDLWTDYGSERRREVFGGSVKVQRVLQREGNTVLVENEMEAQDREYRDQRRYTHQPYERIVEEFAHSEVLQGMVTHLFEEVAEGTRVTLIYDLKPKSWRGRLLSPLLGRFLRGIGDALLYNVERYFHPEEEDGEGQTG
ncbi:MAG: hypothetical protein ACE5IG_03505 [Dehalococcoidia bacterium]